MFKHGRPCVLVLRLKFRGNKHDFAVPFRSNISPNTPKWQYFKLPPRSTTKLKFRHGIHYIKMFPIKKQYLQKFRISGNVYYENIKRIVDANERKIVNECQSYLDYYDLRGKPRFAVDIDYLLKLIRD